MKESDIIFVTIMFCIILIFFALIGGEIKKNRNLITNSVQLEAKQTKSITNLTKNQGLIIEALKEGI